MCIERIANCQLPVASGRFMAVRSTNWVKGRIPVYCSVYTHTRQHVANERVDLGVLGGGWQFHIYLNGVKGGGWEEGERATEG